MITIRTEVINREIYPEERRDMDIKRKLEIIKSSLKESQDRLQKELSK